MAQNMGLNGGIARHGFLRLFLKEELLRLYCKCGEALHQGNIEKLIAPWRRKVTDFPAINAIAQKIKDLLNFHLIVGPRLSSKSSVWTACSTVSHRSSP